MLWCFDTGGRELREGVPKEVVRPVIQDASCPFRVPKDYPQEKGATVALEFVGVRPSSSVTRVMTIV